MRIFKPKGEHDDNFAYLYPDDIDVSASGRRRRRKTVNPDDIDGDDANADYDGYLDNLTDPDDPQTYLEC